jgi:glycosyltransferase involved in cell wall biosynthesis
MHNNGTYVRAAVESMLCQTLGDFEFIIVDDASTDNSMEVVRSFSDKRIVFLKNASNLGVAKSLNVGLAAARGEYIARMDADDISVKERLATQVAFLDSNRSVGVCGSWIRCFGAARSFLLTYPTGTDCVKSYLLLGNPLAHPSVCMRASLIKDNGLKYDETFAASQDYEFWTKCIERMEIDNIPEPLLRYRIHGESVSKNRQSKSDEHATSVVTGQLRRFNVDMTPEQISFHRRIGHGAGMWTRAELISAEEWLRKLLKLNQEKSVWPQRGLEEAVGFVWFRICQNSIGLGPWVIGHYSRSELSGIYRPLLREKVAFGVNVLKGWALGSQPTGNLEIWTEQRSAKDA